MGDGGGGIHRLGASPLCSSSLCRAVVGGSTTASQLPCATAPSTHSGRGLPMLSKESSGSCQIKGMPVSGRQGDVGEEPGQGSLISRLKAGLQGGMCALAGGRCCNKLASAK